MNCALCDDENVWIRYGVSFVAVFYVMRVLHFFIYCTLTFEAPSVCELQCPFLYRSTVQFRSGCVLNCSFVIFFCMMLSEIHQSLSSQY